MSKYTTWWFMDQTSSPVEKSEISQWIKWSSIQIFTTIFQKYVQVSPANKIGLTNAF